MPASGSAPGHGAGRDRDDVEGGRGRRTIRAVLHFDDWLTGKQPFVVAETDGELEVVARGSHGCRDSRAVELDRQRLLGGEGDWSTARDGSSADQGRTSLVSARDRELTPSGYA